MNPLHPRHLTLLRIHYAIGALVLLVLVVIGSFAVAREVSWWPVGWTSGAGTLILLAAVALLPGRRYRAWGFAAGEDELTVKHGLMIRKVTIVPFGRVQHIDVAQGPIQRMLGLATLVLNTAGTRGAAVRLPGLLHPQAEEMREQIRGKIRQDLM
ncbi:MAG TPA: PH domain-containing protein [Allosphingosinicella sp.]|nr:PH domain-containing protein [Allosphingosinicella sp.]